MTDEMETASTATTAPMTVASLRGTISRNEVVQNPQARPGRRQRKQRRPKSSNTPWSTGRGITEETVSKVAARVSGFEGDVMAWSFGATAGVIGCPDFELEVPDLGREVPVLIGQSSSEAEMVDGEFCLLNPVVTCLARSGEIFTPPLLLRFPVGDVASMESGSDDGIIDVVEEDYYTSLKNRYSVVKREEGSAIWVPIVGEIKKMDNGMFLLEVQVSHFTDYALKQPVKVDQGRTEIVELKKLPHESRRNVFLIVNQGSEDIVVFYWPRRTWQFWISKLKMSIGFGSFGLSGAIDRKILDSPLNRVESEVVYSSGRPAVLHASDKTSLEVAWATLEQHDGYRLVTVWGNKVMEHKKAMVIGMLHDKVYALVQGIRVEADQNIGNKVREKLRN